VLEGDGVELISKPTTDLQAAVPTTVKGLGDRTDEPKT